MAKSLRRGVYWQRRGNVPWLPCCTWRPCHHIPIKKYISQLSAPALHSEQTAAQTSRLTFRRFKANDSLVKFFFLLSLNYELRHETAVPEWEAFYLGWWLTCVLMLRLNRFDYNDFSGGYLGDVDYPLRRVKFPPPKQNPFDYVIMACGNEAVQHPASEL